MSGLVWALGAGSWQAQGCWASSTTSGLAFPAVVGWVPVPLPRISRAGGDSVTRAVCVTHAPGLCHSGPVWLQLGHRTGRLEAWGFRAAAPGSGWFSFRHRFVFRTWVSGRRLAWSCPCFPSDPSPLGAFTGEGGGENTASPRRSFAASWGPSLWPFSPVGKVLLFEWVGDGESLGKHHNIWLSSCKRLSGCVVWVLALWGAPWAVSCARETP